MGIFNKLFGKGESEADAQKTQTARFVQQAKASVTAQVDDINRQRAQLATQVQQSERRMKEKDARLRDPDLQGISRRQVEEDFNHAVQAIQVARRHEQILSQGLSDHIITVGKLDQLIADSVSRSSADLLLQLKVVMEQHEQGRQLSAMAMSELQTIDLSVTTPPAVDAAAAMSSLTSPPPVADPAAAPTPAADTRTEADKAAERERKMRELMGPMTA